MDRFRRTLMHLFSRFIYFFIFIVGSVIGGYVENIWYYYVSYIVPGLLIPLLTQSISTSFGYFPKFNGTIYEFLASISTFEIVFAFVEPPKSYLGLLFITSTFLSK